MGSMGIEGMPGSQRLARLERDSGALRVQSCLLSSFLQVSVPATVKRKGLCGKNTGLHPPAGILGKSICLQDSGGLAVSALLT